MNTNRILAGILVGLVGMSAGCARSTGSDIGDPSAGTKARVLSWDSPQLQRAKTEWEETLLSLGRTTKDNAEDHHRVLDGVLSKYLSTDDLRALARSCGELPICVDDRGRFVNALLDHMLVAFVGSGDRDSLVTQLSTRFIDRINPHYVEWYVTFFGEWKGTLKYPVLIFGDAYSRSAVPETRRAIAGAVRRGFSRMNIPELNDSGQSDDEYVGRAMAWYRARKDELFATTKIYSGEMGPPEPLFVSRAEHERAMQEWSRRNRGSVAAKAVGACAFLALMAALIACVRVWLRRRHRMRTQPVAATAEDSEVSRPKDSESMG